MTGPEADELKRGDLIRLTTVPPNAPRKERVFSVTIVRPDLHGMTKIYTSVGRVLYPEQVERYEDV